MPPEQLLQVLAAVGAVALVVLVLRHWRRLFKLALLAALVVGVAILIGGGADELCERFQLPFCSSSPQPPPPGPPAGGFGADPRPLPDFAVRLVVQDPVGPQSSDSGVQFWVTVINYAAPYPGDIYVMRREYVADGEQGFARIDGLEHGQQKVVQLPATTGVKGRFNALLVVDPHDQIPELDETNNAYPPVAVEFY